MRIAVFGSGGLGGYLGGKLSQSGEEVIFIARGEHLKAIRKNGLEINSTEGNFVVYPELATDDPNEVGEVDTIILGVKTWQVLESAKAMRPMIGPETSVIALQNGVASPSQLAETLGAKHVVIGICIIRSFILGPGRLCHTFGVDPNLKLGEMAKSPINRVENLSRLFKKTGISVTIPPDIHSALWEKFLLFSIASGMGAITRSATDVWRNMTETRQMAENAVSEATMVAQTLGINLPSQIVRSTMNLVDNMADGHFTSMATDLMEGKPSEIEAAIGIIIRLGQKSKVDTPINKLIYNSLLPQELRARE